MQRERFLDITGGLGGQPGADVTTPGAPQCPCPFLSFCSAILMGDFYLCSCLKVAKWLPHLRIPVYTPSRKKRKKATRKQSFPRNSQQVAAYVTQVSIVSHGLHK